MIKKDDTMERVPTGIKNLDDGMMGGLVRNSINMIAGGPGSGKSIFAMQYLVNGATKYNEPGVYITLEEGKDNIMKNMNSFGWDLEKLDKEIKVSIIEISPTDIQLEVHKQVEKLESQIINKLKAKRIVIDSMTSYSLLFKSELVLRASYLNLFKMLRNWKLCSLLTSEYDIEGHKVTPLDFEVDSILWIYNSKIKGIRTRSLEIFKMRGTKHTTKTFPMQIKDNNGIIIYPAQNIF
ncbi:MAG: hypothetical protein IH934_00075 [Nanoarchaeota archaeon]|nr:hypothetical protein [Nanoarchaeota archaeon]